MNHLTHAQSFFRTPDSDMLWQEKLANIAKLQAGVDQAEKASAVSGSPKSPEGPLPGP